MRICIFTNHFYPEDFKVNDIAFEMVVLGYDVTVFTAVPDYPGGKFYKGYSLFRRNIEIVRGVKVYRLPIVPRGNGKTFSLIFNYMSYFFSLYFFTIFHSIFTKYDVVFVHHTSPFFLSLSAVYLKKYQHIPLVFWALDLWPESLTAAVGMTNPFIIRPQLKMVQYVYDNSNKILIGSKGFERSICEKGNYKNKLIYFPNWAECNRTEANLSLYNNSNPFCDFKRDDFVILFAGNIGVSQNLDCVLDTANKYCLNKQIKFVFLGDGRHRLRLIQRVSVLGLSDTFFFPGKFPLESMPFFMKKADILLVSLKNEQIFNLTVPGKVQFYMAQGKPILAMLNGDGSDLIKEADCGIAVPANDKNSLYAAILKFQQMNKDELSRMGANGEAFYNANFRKEDRIAQLNDIFAEFIK